MENIVGKWHISYSTLSMWQGSPVKADPVITYKRESNHTWTDRVDYVVEEKSSNKLVPVSVHGLNTVSRNGTLRWRGQGLYTIFRCTCKLLASDPCMREYVVVFFGPTAFTDSGIDILTRQRELPEQQLQQILADISRDPAIKALLAKGKLKPTRRVEELPGQLAAAQLAQQAAREAQHGADLAAADEQARQLEGPAGLQMAALGPELQALRFSAPAALGAHKLCLPSQG